MQTRPAESYLHNRVCLCQVPLSDTVHLLQVKVLEYPTLAFSFQYPVATASGRKLPMVFSRCVRHPLPAVKPNVALLQRVHEVQSLAVPAHFRMQTAEPFGSQPDLHCHGFAAASSMLCT